MPDLDCGDKVTYQLPLIKKDLKEEAWNEFSLSQITIKSKVSKIWA